MGLNTCLDYYKKPGEVADQMKEVNKMKKGVILIALTMVTVLMLSGVASATSGPWFCPWKVCRPGNDWDWIPRAEDNCPNRFNPSQRDTDSDGSGNACDSNEGDIDWDGELDTTDNCVYAWNPSQRDTDDDGKGDMCDQNNKDKDWDGIINKKDNCIYTYNPSQLNSNNRPLGDACDCSLYWLLKGCY